MFETTTVERCAACARTTPHTRWRARPRLALAALAALGAIAFALASDWPVAAALALAAAWLALRERDAFARIACDRCRERELRRLARERPGLRTERFFL